DQLLALVRFQPTASSAVRLEGMLAAGLGAGVTPAELRFLRPGHVIRRDGLVTVLAGDPPREVAVLSAYAERLWVAARRAESLGLSFLVTGGGSPDNPSALSQFVADINGSDQAPRLVASRLRTSWLVAHL